MQPAPLTPRERALLDRQVRRKRWSLYSSIAGAAAGVGLGALYAATGRLNAARSVVIVLLLVGAKNHLRIYRLAGILEKLRAGAEA